MSLVLFPHCYELYCVLKMMLNSLPPLSVKQGPLGSRVLADTQVKMRLLVGGSLIQYDFVLLKRRNVDTETDMYWRKRMGRSMENII